MAGFCGGGLGVEADRRPWCSCCSGGVGLGCFSCCGGMVLVVVGAPLVELMTFSRFGRSGEWDNPRGGWVGPRFVGRMVIMLSLPLETRSLFSSRGLWTFVSVTLELPVKYV
jgi:hypothetical protein